MKLSQFLKLIQNYHIKNYYNTEIFSQKDGILLLLEKEDKVEKDNIIILYDTLQRYQLIDAIYDLYHIKHSSIDSYKQFIIKTFSNYHNYWLNNDSYVQGVKGITIENLFKILNKI